MTTIEGVTGDISGLPIQPVPTPNRQKLREIPLGVQIISITWEGDEVPDIQSVTWNEDERDRLVNGLEDEETEYRTFLLWAEFQKPESDAKEGEDSMSVEEIISDVHLSGTSKVDDIVRQAVELARKGLVRNPF